MWPCLSCEISPMYLREASAVFILNYWMGSDTPPETPPWRHVKKIPGSLSAVTESRVVSFALMPADADVRGCPPLPLLAAVSLNTAGCLISHLSSDRTHIPHRTWQRQASLVWKLPGAWFAIFRSTWIYRRLRAFFGKAGTHYQKLPNQNATQLKNVIFFMNFW